MQNAAGLNRGLLERETERQNRIRREAKKPAGNVVSLRRETEAAMPDMEGAYKVAHIPGIRPALIPLDAVREGDGWSNPFSLAMADIEPWISFHRGYRSSRLFLSSDPAGGADSLDYAVRALLELKRIDAKFILEPPVQINACCDYAEIDADDEDVVIRRVQQEHEKQLRKAAAQGRAMGDSLYEALMGEGYVNLVKAWEKAHGRKPSPVELQLMLTTGRLRPAARERLAAPAATTVMPPISPIEAAALQAGAIERYEDRPAPALPAQAAAAPLLPPCPSALPPWRRLTRKTLLHLCAVAACAVALFAWAALA